MKIIKLTHNKIAKVDDKNFEHLNQWRWHYRPDGYAARRNGKKALLMHRYINNTPEGMDTDHINGDKLDNRKINLRSATRSQNKANEFIRKNNTSGYKGVCWATEKKKWKAQLRVMYKRKFLGYFDTPQEAAIAYDLAVVKYHGEYGRTNQ